MRGTRLLPILCVVAAATVALAQAPDPESVPKPERAVTCWDCHQAPQGLSGPLVTFVNLIPPAQAGGTLGQPFAFPIQVQNAWSAEILAVQVRVDLTQAPSLGFASDVAPLDALLDAAIAVDPARATEAQAHALTVPVPFGETRLEVRLRPGDASDLTGPDLTLKVYPGLSAPQGEPYATVDDAGPGGDEVFVVEDRATLAGLGYGNWTFVAETSLLPDPQRPGLPAPSGGSIPYQLEVKATAEASADRVAGLGTRTPVPKGGSTTLPFRLVGLAPPAPGEAVTLSWDVWAFYDHASKQNDDHENATRTLETPLPVSDVGGAPALQATPGTQGPVLRVQNGPTMATVSEAVGYASAFLLVASVASGGMFGKASRRGLNHLFGQARRRVAFHNFLSYGLMLAAVAHTVLFVVEAAYHWTLGLIWGGGAILAMLGLAFTGALQVPLIRRWGYAGWRWTHYGLAVATAAFTLAHVLLDGVHFADVQNALGWDEPLDPRASAA